MLFCMVGLVDRTPSISRKVAIPKGSLLGQSKLQTEPTLLSSRNSRLRLGREGGTTSRPILLSNQVAADFEKKD